MADAALAARLAASPAPFVCHPCAKRAGWIEKPVGKSGVIAYCAAMCSNEPTAVFPRVNWIVPDPQNSARGGNG